MYQLYLIALIPPEPLKDEIQQIKLDMKDKFNSSHSLNAPPHITLLSPFRLDEELEEHLDSLLTNLAQEFEPFEIELKNFSAFPPRVVFIDVIKSPKLIDLQNNLEDIARSKPEMFSYNYQEREYHPHITLAFKDLTRVNFYEAWDEFKDRKLDEQFMADRLHLLKHNGTKWEPIKAFPMQE